MPTNTYDKGDAVRLNASFTIGGVATNPTNILLRIKDQSGNETIVTTGTISELSTGNWFYDVQVTGSGQWWYRWEGSGNLTAVDENSLLVDPSEFD